MKKLMLLMFKLGIYFFALIGVCFSIFMVINVARGVARGYNKEQVSKFEEVDRFGGVSIMKAYVQWDTVRGSNYIFANEALDDGSEKGIDTTWTLRVWNLGHNDIDCTFVENHACGRDVVILSELTPNNLICDLKSNDVIVCKGNVKFTTDKGEVIMEPTSVEIVGFLRVDINHQFTFVEN